MSLLSSDQLNELPKLSLEEIDAMPMGVIKVDDHGHIEIFNRYEVEFSGLEPSTVLGRHFFTQVAPCTNNSLFYGRFKKGIKAGRLDHIMPYTYTYKMKPTNVTIHLFRHVETATNWILTRKRDL